MPVTPKFWLIASSKPGSSDQTIRADHPKPRRPLSRGLSARARSRRARRAARRRSARLRRRGRWGGAGEQPLFVSPRTISALVPTSTIRVSSSANCSGASLRAHGGGVGADMAGDAGENVYPRVGMHGLTLDLVGPERGCCSRSPARRARRQAPSDRRRAAGGASPDCRRRRLPARPPVDASPSAAELPDERVDRLAHGRGHLRRAAGVHHRIGDAAHQIFAEADLRVHQAGGGLHLAVAQIDIRWPAMVVEPMSKATP